MRLINGWWFDFDKMQASRDVNWHLYDIKSDRNIVDIQFDRGLMWKKVTDYAWRGHFFDDPESHFNKEIERAYSDWLCEKLILR